MTTMPGSRKLARKSVTLAMQLGLSKADAARLVQIICDEVAAVLWRRSPDIDVTWLAGIAAEARVIQDQAPSGAAVPTGEYITVTPSPEMRAAVLRAAGLDGPGALERPGA